MSYSAACAARDSLFDSGRCELDAIIEKVKDRVRVTTSQTLPLEVTPSIDTVVALYSMGYRLVRTADEGEAEWMLVW